MTPAPPTSPQIDSEELGCGGLQKAAGGTTLKRRFCVECKCELHNTDGEEIEAVVEKAESVKCLHTPILPSQSDFDKHRISHIPYRNLCPHCLAAMGRENLHVSADHTKRAIPTIAIDYMFLTTKVGQVQD